MARKLRDPKGEFQIIVRKLAEAAMSVTHHDAGEDEIGYIHEVEVMERKFTAILNGKMRAALQQGSGQ